MINPLIIVMVVISRKVVAGPLASMRGKRNAHSVLVRKPAVQRPLGRPRHRWENNIKIYLYGNGGRGLIISKVGGFTVRFCTVICILFVILL